MEVETLKLIFCKWGTMQKIEQKGSCGKGLKGEVPVLWENREGLKA